MSEENVTLEATQATEQRLKLAKTSESVSLQN